MSAKKVEEKKNMERAEMQEPLHKAISEAIAELNLLPTVDHARRLIRCLMREAAKIALVGGAPPQAFAGLAFESIIKESNGTDDGKVVESPFSFTVKGKAEA